MKKFIKNPWVIGIGSSLLVAILVSLIEVLFPGILTTAINSIKGVLGRFITFLTNVFTFKIALWVIFIVLVLLYFGYRLIAKLKTKEIDPAYLNYCEETNDTKLKWTWDWHKNGSR